MNEHPLANAIRPSACPGLLRIVPALDGGICRIKLAGGVISAVQAQAVAEAAGRYAGGVIEATNRANLQIRGIGEQHADLIATLLAAGLGPDAEATDTAQAVGAGLAREASGGLEGLFAGKPAPTGVPISTGGRISTLAQTSGADDVRNLMLSPSAGIDAQMLIDTRPLAAQILATLQGHMRLHELSAKFALQLDGGEALAMLEHPHDLWLSALLIEDRPYLAFGLAGCPAHDTALAAVPLEHGHGLVVAVLELFLDLARPEQTRMRHLLAEVPVESFLAQLSARLDVALTPVPHWQRSGATGLRHIGTYPQRQPDLVHIGAVFPLGRLDAAMLDGVARVALQQGDGSLRLTPWQSLLLPNIRRQDAARVSARLHQLGLLCDAGQALARIIACTGAGGCAKGLADTKADARLLATLLPGRAQGVHLSGCGRSCAAAHVAPSTLLAVSPGHYDLYLRDAAQPGFGLLHARNLTIDAAGALLEARSRSSTDD
ncbi:precorrin-3B synthase [Pseudomonas gingeri]|uniref:precorrin-3B synthase n=1 Tax=Pseudomonas gingeri TaxID=117681 RepID=UPI0015A01761|nr:precorrin-3B synthase [Pseudomonas gingeri]NWA00557.1 precorrin-3B synthase [Pseudomonas gingeri]NWA14728.1 precorrin-3B synthase [Pseudomonas gingeri]NWA56095.1 precorrin-3B synthase [Pseudomonas gingeri]NWA96712.1 precorrin-3B synthase [Pseudomonas gingeri]NWB03568.1 precorrin-3B synthase [Pseudomonas gingeri]